MSGLLSDEILAVGNALGGYTDSESRKTEYFDIGKEEWITGLLPMPGQIYPTSEKTTHTASSATQGTQHKILEKWRHSG